MSAVIYAAAVTCDYPGCKSSASATLDEGISAYVPPAGWLSLTGKRAINVMTPFGVNVSDLCPVHARFTVDSLAAAFELKRTDGDGN
jgi:hypothetical protein